MKKYNSEDIYSDDDKEIDYPQFTWDWYQIGGRYSGQIKLRVDKNNEEYRWRHYDGGGRNGRLFWSYLLNNMEEFSKKSFMYSEEDYFASMGYRDGFLYVDGAKISDIMNIDKIGCFTFMNADGEAYSREWWNGSDFIENNDFEIVKIDIDQERDLAIENKIEFVPTMVLFKNGKEIDRIQGVADKEFILEKVEKYK